VRSLIDRVVNDFLVVSNISGHLQVYKVLSQLVIMDSNNKVNNNSKPS
jgi:hypothetical protein